MLLQANAQLSGRFVVVENFLFRKVSGKNRNKFPKFPGGGNFGKFLDSQCYSQMLRVIEIRKRNVYKMQRNIQTTKKLFTQSDGLRLRLWKITSISPTLNRVVSDSNKHVETADEKKNSNPTTAGHRNMSQYVTFNKSKREQYNYRVLQTMEVQGAPNNTGTGCSKRYRYRVLQTIQLQGEPKKSKPQRFCQNCIKYYPDFFIDLRTKVEIDQNRTTS